MSSQLLFEIGCEEIPARFLSPTLAQLQTKCAAELKTARIGHGAIKTYGTPRRMALVIDEVADQQEGYEERRVGPFVKAAFDDAGAPTKAGAGFARSCGVEVTELGREQTKKGEKLLFTRQVEGKPTIEVLAELLPALVPALEFPKPMRWGTGGMSFVRPLHWVVALLGGKLIEFNLDDLKAGVHTRGQRFTHPEAFAVTGVDDYLEGLAARNVIPDPQERKSIIARAVEAAAIELGGELYPDPGLLDEVTNLVELPVVISGKFDPRFLELPPEAPISAMRAHQRYFSIRKPGTEKELMPAFITVANTPAKDLGLVARGNERVLGARLADAEFYWREDLKTGIEKMRERTAGMIFYKTLGTYLDKTGRVEKLTAHLADELFADEPEVKENAVAAARLCKADLVSMLVGEFPDLQGVMGGEYATAAGQSQATAAAIRDHYLPRSAEDVAAGLYPCGASGDLLSIADKIDSVVACWAAGLAPTGAGDPFALRRAAQGVVNLILAKGYRVNLRALIELAAGLAAPLVDADPVVVAREVTDFILARLRGQLLEGGQSYDVIDACLAVSNGDLVDTIYKIEAVARMKSRADFDALMIAFRRVMNIIEGEPGQVDTTLLEEESEAVLYSEYTRIEHHIEPLLAKGDYDAALAMMADLKPSVDKFFDNVMVNVDDANVKQNRHALCEVVSRVFKTVADFSKIVIAGDKAARQA